MTLEDFERELTQSRDKPSGRTRDRSRSRDREHRSSKHRDDRKRSHHESSRHHSSRHHRSRSRDRDRDRDRDRHRHKRSRHHRDSSVSREQSSRKDHSRRDRHRSRSPARAAPSSDDNGASEDEWVEKAEYAAPPGEETLDEALEEARDANLKRDAWMEAPSALDVDYVQRKRKADHEQAHTKETHERKVHKNELNHQLRDVRGEHDRDGIAEKIRNEPAQHKVDYEFGDAGSSWRMTRLKAVYRQAEESGRSVEEVALERYGDLRAFDDAREEEIEIDRRKRYGKEYVGKIKPSGELFQERKLDHGIHRQDSPKEERKHSELPQGITIQEQSPPMRTAVLDRTALNKLKAQMMKAKLRGGPEADRLEAEYNQAAAAAANQKDPEVVVLGGMENRMLAGSREGEVVAVNTKRGRERGLVEENEDMSIEDMVRAEKRTKGQYNEGMLMADRISKDAAFKNDLDYMDDNVNNLAKRGQKSEINLRNTTISDMQKMNRILDSCPLCHHDDTGRPPEAPIVSLGTRTYLTLPTEPEISEGGAVIVPQQHRVSLLECDDDEWEEIRNFMKSLTRLYHDQGREVIFYENAATPQRKRHAALNVIPLPYELGATAPAFFREAMLSSDEEWSQHVKVIDTGAKSRQGLGKLAFRRSLVKEMPYFHVWFDLDGGLGHVIEDANRWPKGDLFAREVIGGMLDCGPEIVKRQGRWHREDRRVEGFRKRWRKFDWTRVLTEG